AELSGQVYNRPVMASGNLDRTLGETLSLQRLRALARIEYFIDTRFLRPTFGPFNELVYTLLEPFDWHEDGRVYHDELTAKLNIPPTRDPLPRGVGVAQAGREHIYGEEQRIPFVTAEGATQGQEAPSHVIAGSTSP